MILSHRLRHFSWGVFGCAMGLAILGVLLVQFADSARRARGGWGDSAWAPLGAALGIAAAIGVFMALAPMTNAQIGVAFVGIMVLLLVAGVPIGIVMIVAGFGGIWMIRGDPSLGMRTLSQSSTEYLNSYFFGVVPLYVLMGLLISSSDVGRDTFAVARWYRPALFRLVATGAVGVALYLLYCRQVWSGWLPEEAKHVVTRGRIDLPAAFVGQLLSVMPAIAVGGLLYLGIALKLNIFEAKQITGMVTQRFRRG